MTVKSTSYLIPLHTGLGNAVLLTPLIRTLRAIHRDNRITLLCDQDSGIDALFADDPDVNHIIFEPDRGPYDVYFHTYLGSSWKLALQVKCLNPFMRIIYQLPDTQTMSIWKRLFLRLLNVTVQSVYADQHEPLQYLQLLTNLQIPEEHWQTKISIKTTISSPIIKMPYWIIQLGASNMIKDAKLWPLSHWKTLIEHLIETGQRIILVGDHNETDLAKTIPTHPSVINQIGKTAIRELIQLIFHADVILGVDSGVTHISGAFNKKTLVLWGPTHFEKSHQSGENTRFIHLHKPCSPCRGPERMGLLSGPDSVKKCTHQLACMADITPEMVISKLKELSWL